ncbi:ATP-binding cassette domain-containing protein [Natrinema halophilum]|uniref:ATP-binding cassette domain-containing protein n=1 Tax=Natrinema halophilum TaxID=1699371 RepID=UPI001F34C5EB|nr:ATP-binding cassette domain-containing protein [Natrinema halophilum]UHQ96209.1 ATP-binding cassette domain-containing protein [Natrinema halophilum]
MTDKIIELENVSKQFGGIVAIDDVTINCDDEGVTALIGPNGAGKTTLFNLITGKLHPTSGTIAYKGKDITNEGVAARVKQGIGRSFQLNNLFDDLTVRQNIRASITARTRNRFNFYSPVGTNVEISKEVDEILELLDLQRVENISCNKLAYGDQRRVEIALSLGTDPDFVLLDEPTAGLNPDETEEFVDLLESVNEQTNKSFLIIEHDMDVVFSIASRVIVLNEGAIIADGSPKSIQQNDDVEKAYLGTENFDEIRSDSKNESKFNSKQPILSLDDVNSFYDESHILHNVSMSINEGEVIALLGRNGAGKTTILRSIIGVVSPRSGSVVFNGNEISGMPTHKIARTGIGYVPQERRIFPNLTVEENIEVAIEPDSNWSIKRLYDIFPRLEERKYNDGKNLSGGEQQMLSIARTLGTDPDLLLLDEPSEGLAPVIVNKLQKNLSRLIEETDITLILTEQNSELAFSLADRIALVDKGQIVWTGTPYELDNSEELIQKHLTVAKAGKK